MKKRINITIILSSVLCSTGILADSLNGIDNSSNQNSTSAFSNPQLDNGSTTPGNSDNPGVQPDPSKNTGLQPDNPDNPGLQPAD
jgi:hypothetical protein